LFLDFLICDLLILREISEVINIVKERQITRPPDNMPTTLRASDHFRVSLQNLLLLPVN